MAHTVDAIVYDPSTMIIQMIVMPDDDSELADPAFNPPGMTQLQVPALGDAPMLAGPAAFRQDAQLQDVSVQAADTTTLAIQAAAVATAQPQGAHAAQRRKEYSGSALAGTGCDHYPPHAALAQPLYTPSPG